MSGRKRILIRHLVVWLAAVAVFFFLAEPLSEWLLPDMAGVETWLAVLAVGFLLTTIAFIISLIVALRRRR